MIIWNMSDIIGLVFCGLIILVSTLVWLVSIINDKLHNIRKRNKAIKESEVIK